MGAETAGEARFRCCVMQPCSQHFLCCKLITTVPELAHVASVHCHTRQLNLQLIHAGKKEELAKSCTNGIWQKDRGDWGAQPQVSLNSASLSPSSSPQITQCRPCFQHSHSCASVISERACKSQSRTDKQQRLNCPHQNVPCKRQPLHSEAFLTRPQGL